MMKTKKNNTGCENEIGEHLHDHTNQSRPRRHHDHDHIHLRNPKHHIFNIVSSSGVRSAILIVIINSIIIVIVNMNMSMNTNTITMIVNMNIVHWLSLILFNVLGLSPMLLPTSRKGLNQLSELDRITSAISSSMSGFKALRREASPFRTI